jgi:hypothetical protein
MKLKANRSSRGELTEFGAAFLILLSVALPLINVSFIPIRYLFCQAIIAERAALLGHCEKRSDVYQMLKQDKSWKATLAKVGVTVSNDQVVFIVTNNDGTTKTVIKEGQPLDAQWLPDAKKGPFVYSLMLSTKCAIAPAVYSSSGPPGLTSPVNLTVTGSSQWENVSADSKTSKYFIAE